MAFKYRPELKTLFTVKRNDSELTTEEELKEWQKWTYDCSLMTGQQYEKIRSTYTFMCYSYCTQTSRFETIIKLILMNFVWDDHHEGHGGDIGRSLTRGMAIWAQFSGTLARLEGYVSMAMWKPYSLALYALFEDVYQTYSDGQRRRFIAVWNGYIEGSLTECMIFENGFKFTNIDDYMTMRRKSISIITYLQLLEFSQNICLSDREWNDPSLQELLLLAVDCMIYVNDICSFGLEFSLRGYRRQGLLNMNNVVAITAGLKRCSVDEAINDVIERNRELEIRTKALMESIVQQTGISDTVRLFVKCIDYSIGANWVTSTTIDRYNCR